MKCCICGKEKEGYASNPMPVAGTACCDECNGKVIVPLRVFLATLRTQNLAILITGSEVQLVQPKGRYFTLEELQGLVGGYIELAPRVFDDYLTVVDEEGLLKQKPFNNLSYKIFETDLVGNVLIVPKRIFEKPED